MKLNIGCGLEKNDNENGMFPVAMILIGILIGGSGSYALIKA